VTEARVPTGMKQGVSTVPWRVRSVPRRARLPGSAGVAWRVKGTAGFYNSPAAATRGTG